MDTQANLNLASSLVSVARDLLAVREGEDWESAPWVDEVDTSLLDRALAAENRLFRRFLAESVQF